ncbi:MAG: FIST C-terminal domain-containing protein [Geminicoccaceae bacterium]|nr:FIST C-terminal domain-containing protein [Geminicoccaceae bacterium]
MTDRASLGSISAADWRMALDEALVGLEGAARTGAGLLYVDDGFAEALDPIVDELVRRTGVSSWFGSVTRGVFGAGRTATGAGSLAVLLTPWDESRYRFVGGGRSPEPAAEPAPVRRWALVHGDRRLRRALPVPLRRLPAGTFAVGGLTASGGAPIHVLHRPAEDDLGAMVLDPGVEVVARISQGCRPIGPAHEVSAANGSWIRRLDERPAYEVLRDEVGEILSRQPERIGGYIHVEVTGTDDLRFIRPILALEPRSGEIATAEPLRRGQRLRFVKRDAGAARASFEATLEQLRQDLRGREPGAALYIASRARLTTLFEDPASEVRMVEDMLGPVPLIGFCSDGEIFDARLHDWSSILVLFPW